MRTILINFLLLTNLCSGLALAWDSHPEALVGHDSATVGLLADDHDHADDDLHHDDHCCHGAAHMMGMLPTATAPTMDMTSGYRFSMMHAIPSLYLTPLLRPPIV